MGEGGAVVTDRADGGEGEGLSLGILCLQARRGADAGDLAAQDEYRRVRASFVDREFETRRAGVQNKLVDAHVGERLRHSVYIGSGFEQIPVAILKIVEGHWAHPSIDIGRYGIDAQQAIQRKDRIWCFLFRKAAKGTTEIKLGDLADKAKNLRYGRQRRVLESLGQRCDIVHPFLEKSLPLFFRESVHAFHRRTKLFESKNLSTHELHHVAREKAYVHAHRSSEQNLCVSG
jgi:hypothetical protein